MKRFLKLILLAIIIIPTITYAVPEKPPGQSGGQSEASISYTGATTFSSSKEETDKTYSSTTGGQNALLVKEGTSTITNATVTKSGDSSGDSADFYGVNAAILAYNNATLYIKGGKITTNGSHANAVFAYSTGKIEISDATINTTSNNSGGVMVTGGGT